MRSATSFCLLDAVVSAPVSLFSLEGCVQKLDVLVKTVYRLFRGQSDVRPLLRALVLRLLHYKRLSYYLVVLGKGDNALIGTGMPSEVAVQALSALCADFAKDHRVGQEVERILLLSLQGQLQEVVRSKLVDVRKHGGVPN